MTDINQLKVEQIDVDKIRQLHNQFADDYNKKALSLSNMYEQMQSELKRDYETQIRELNNLNKKVMENHNKVSQFHDSSVKSVIDEKHQVEMERAKLSLETKNLVRKQSEYEQSQASASQNGSNIDLLAQKQYVRQSTAPQEVKGNRRKAADFYFQKKTKSDMSVNAPVVKKNQDFITREVSPQKPSPVYQQHFQPASPINNAAPIRKGQFSYDKVEVTQKAKQPITPSREYKPKAKAADYYMNKSRQKSPMTSQAAPYVKKSSTTSPVPRSPAAYQKKSYGQSSPLRAPVAPSGPKSPELPDKLTEEFKKAPTNYDILDALSNRDFMEANQKKWKELGVLFAEDIIKNAKTPIDYHLRVAENDLGSGFGQVDKQGKLQGLGREVYDHIYEGEFKNNLYDGWGRFISHLGVYWGYWEKGMRHGNGKFVGTNGGAQEGNWVMGKLK